MPRLVIDFTSGHDPGHVLEIRVAPGGLLEEAVESALLGNWPPGATGFKVRDEGGAQVFPNYRGIYLTRSSKQR
jgi:hypothetical protein